MTNREESSAAEHETFPGPGPLKTDDAKRGMRPVEQMMDAAIERIAREAEARGARAEARNTPPGQAITLAQSNHTPTSSNRGSSSLATTSASDAAALMAIETGQVRAGDRRSNGRLRWKGLEVSEEFRKYADRVARGEDLPPFAGKILAEPDPNFPWDPNAHQRAARSALKHQVRLWSGVALFLGLSVAVLVVQVRKQAETWQAPESPLATVTMANQPNGEASPSADTRAATGSGDVANAPVAYNEQLPALAADVAGSVQRALWQRALWQRALWQRALPRQASQSTLWRRPAPLRPQLRSPIRRAYSWPPAHRQRKRA